MFSTGICEMASYTFNVGFYMLNIGNQNKYCYENAKFFHTLAEIFVFYAMLSF